MWHAGAFKFGYPRESRTSRVFFTSFHTIPILDAQILRKQIAHVQTHFFYFYADLGLF